MRDLVISSMLVAGVALGATSSPVDDSAQTKADRDVTILVLLNDPADSEITGVGAPSSGVGTVMISGEAVVYSPNGFEGNDTFTYETGGGTATPTTRSR